MQRIDILDNPKLMKQFSQYMILLFIGFGIIYWFWYYFLDYREKY